MKANPKFQSRRDDATIAQRFSAGNLLRNSVPQGRQNFSRSAFASNFCDTILKRARLCLALFCLFSAGTHRLEAQPRITVQPRNVSVLIGQDAQFTVTASGVAPFTYQWRFNGMSLPTETNRTLAITNVALPQLGRYNVVVSNNTGTVTSDPAWLLLARWTELVTFGRSDSMSDCASSGSWPDYLAHRLGIRLRKYAVTFRSPPEWSGDRPSVTMQIQVGRYLSANTPATNTLFATWNGGVDMIFMNSTASPEESVSGQLATIQMLIDAGARHILIPKLWPPDILPFWTEWFPFLTREKVLQYDSLLDKELEALQARHGMTFYRPDMFAFMALIAQNPPAYGFRRPLGTDFSCDQLHFNSPVHRLNAQEHYRSLTPPVRIETATQIVGGDLALHWTGGSPPFRIETTSDLLSGQWHQTGELTFVNSIKFQSASSHGFFRVLHLGQ